MNEQSSEKMTVWGFFLVSLPGVALVVFAIGVLIYGYRNVSTDLIMSIFVPGVLGISWIGIVVAGTMEQHVQSQSFEQRPKRLQWKLDCEIRRLGVSPCVIQLPWAKVGGKFFYFVGRGENRHLPTFEVCTEGDPPRPRVNIGLVIKSDPSLAPFPVTLSSRYYRYSGLVAMEYTPERLSSIVYGDAIREQFTGYLAEDIAKILATVRKKSDIMMFQYLQSHSMCSLKAHSFGLSKLRDEGISL